MEVSKKKFIKLCVIIAVISITVIWLVLPAATHFFSCLPLLTQGWPGIQAFAPSLQTYFPEKIFTGILETNYFSLAAIPGWILLFLFDGAAIYSLFKQRSSNPILDDLPEEAGNNEHGRKVIHRTIKEIASTRYIEQDKISELDKVVDGKTKPGGIYIGSKGDDVLLNREDMHVLLLAPPRVGKTRRILIETIGTLMYSDESFVAFDPKGELYGSTAETVAQHGSEVIRVDFSNPTFGHRWNPLERVIEAYNYINYKHSLYDKYHASLFTVIENIKKDLSQTKNPDKRTAIRKELDEAEREIREYTAIAEREVNQILDTLHPADKDKDGNSFFFKVGGNHLIRLVLHYVLSSPACPRACKTFETAYQVLMNYCTEEPIEPKKPKDTFNPLFEATLILPTYHPARKAMRDVGSAGRYLKDFMQTASNVLSSFTDVELSSMMHATDLPVDKLCDKKTATYLIIPQEGDIYKRFALLYVDQMYTQLLEKATKEARLPRRMTIIAEEAGQLPPISNLDQRLSIAAGLGIRWIICLQDFAQLDQTYGKAVATTVINDCQIKILLATGDTERTVPYFVKKLGTYTIRKESASTSKAPTSIFSDRVTSSDSTESRPLLLAHELENWHPDFGAIIKVLSTEPIIAPVPDLSETPFNKIFGMGDKAHNQKKQARMLQRKIHEEVITVPQWGPEVNTASEEDEDKKLQRLLEISDEERSEKRETFINKRRWHFKARTGLAKPNEIIEAMQVMDAKAPKQDTNNKPQKQEKANQAQQEAGSSSIKS